MFQILRAGLRRAPAGKLVRAAIFLAVLETCIPHAHSQEKTVEKVVNPSGQPADAHEGKLVDQPPRYYVWYDTEGWHLRSAAKGKALAHFTGTIELTQGEFGKLRPIGLEAKGKYPDRWQIDAARRKLDFDIHTSSSFDGFDFTVAKDQMGELKFDLNIGGKPMSKRVFVGKDSEHPAELPFAILAKP